jgi:Ca2+-binding EF-hand superfamily protein
MTSKSDTLISNNDSNPHKIINNNNNNIIEKENNFKDIPENLSNKKNFTDIFTENDKMIINIFIDFIYSITILESKEENLRESLSLCDDIDLYAIFNIFNVDKTNYISKMNFTDVCNKEYLLFPTELQIKLIYDRFDLNNDEQLDIEEFINMLTPLNKAYLTLCNKDNFDTNKNISFESKKKIINLLKAIIDNESITYELRTKLISNKNFNFIDLWGLLMKYSQDDNTLTKKEFNNFLENFGCYFTQCELDIIFNKLSKGKDLIEYSTLYNGIIN